MSTAPEGTSDLRSDVRGFLTSRRSRLSPRDVGLPTYGDRRRVQGLRREEVALLTGVSTDYYTRIERGNLVGVSDQVLASLAVALRLDESERSHLLDLASTANSGSDCGLRASRRRLDHHGIRSGVCGLLDGMPMVPAYLRNDRLDLLYANRMGRALFHEIFAGAHDVGPPPNLARYLFLDPRSRRFYTEWETVAQDVLGAMRTKAGRYSRDESFSDLVAELSSGSTEFRQWWATHDVRLYHSSRKVLNHSEVGRLDLVGEAMVLPTDELTIVAYTAASPVSPEAGAATLEALACWVDTAEAPQSGPDRAGLSEPVQSS